MPQTTVPIEELSKAGRAVGEGLGCAMGLTTASGSTNRIAGDHTISIDASTVDALYRVSPYWEFVFD